jgi:hypothetical protein
MYGVVVFAEAALAATDIKFTPGPFVSIHSEVLPVILCLVVVLVGIRSLFFGTAKRRLFIALLMVQAVAAAGHTVGFAVSYWNEPYSRGRLVGW